jgi:anthranilate/para-aminobenzoate synthase component II
MGLMECASGASLDRGYDYYKRNKVGDITQTGNFEFTGTVQGVSLYHTIINVMHPYSSKCDCPKAKGKRVVCKHMIAMYFKEFPEEATRYHDDVVKREEEYEEWQDKIEDKVADCIMKMSKSELQNELFSLVLDLPDWKYEQFLQAHNIDIDDD